MSEPSPRVQRWVILLATLIGVAATASLGMWQLRRAAEKEALQAALDQRSRLPALPQSQLPRDEQAAKGDHYRSTRLQGRWLAERTIFLENRQMSGSQPGFFVVTPLLLAPGDAVLVQRGWAPRDIRDRTLLPDVPTPAGEVTVSGRIAPPPGRLYSFGGVESGRIRQNLDLESFSREIGVALRPFSIMQEGEPPAADGLLRQWPLPAVNVQMHYGYAFQWFALCALMAGLYVWFQLLLPRRRRKIAG